MGQLSNAVFERLTAGKQKQALPESMVEEFRRNGYTTIGIGKISREALDIFDFRAAPTVDGLVIIAHCRHAG